MPYSIRRGVGLWYAESVSWTFPNRNDAVAKSYWFEGVRWSSTRFGMRRSVLYFHTIRIDICGGGWNGGMGWGIVMWWCSLFYCLAARLCWWSGCVFVHNIVCLVWVCAAKYTYMKRYSALCRSSKLHSYGVIRETLIFFLDLWRKRRLFKILLHFAHEFDLLL